MGIIQISTKIKQPTPQESLVPKFSQVHLNPAKRPMPFHILTLANKSFYTKTTSSHKH